jgi:hypothetical protein
MVGRTAVGNMVRIRMAMEQLASMSCASLTISRI